MPNSYIGLTMEWAIVRRALLTLYRDSLLPMISKMGILVACSCFCVMPASFCSNAYPVQHPVFPQGVTDLEAALKKARIAIETSDSTLEAWNPPYADFFYVGCPNCTGGVQFRSDNLEWDPEKPDQIICKYCKHVYPSPDYPLNHSTRVTTPAGTVREYP